MTKQKQLSNQIETSNSDNVEMLYSKVISYIDKARSNVQKTIDTEMVKAYWLIGRDIIEEEQQGKSRAEYGANLLKELSTKLNSTIDLCGFVMEYNNSTIPLEAEAYHEI